MAKNRLSEIEKEFVRKRANGCCEYCKFPFDYSHGAFHLDHVIPPAKGGSEDLDNFAFACDRCNAKKWTRTEWMDPETGNSIPLFHPRKDEWSAHFSWSDDFSEVLGQTPSGRATIALLELNREGLVNVRKALYAWGVHPAKLS
mgnify:CR=1 FL=1